MNERERPEQRRMTPHLLFELLPPGGGSRFTAQRPHVVCLLCSPKKKKTPKFKKYTANVKLDSAHRYVEIDMIFETARFELRIGSSASQDDHFSPLRHPKGINRRRIAEALEEGNDERQHPQGGRHHIQFTTTQTATPSMTPPGAADNHI